MERFSKEGTAQGLRSVETTRGFRHRTVATAPGHAEGLSSQIPGYKQGNR